MKSVRAALGLCAVLALPALASAQATYTSQEREVETKSHSELLLWQQGTDPSTAPVR